MICYGFQDNYYSLRVHGEPSSLHNLARENISCVAATMSMTIYIMYDYHDNMNDMLNENIGFEVSENFDDNDTYSKSEGMNGHAEKYFELLEDAEQEVYPNCKKFTKLPSLFHAIRIFELKVLSSWRNKSKTMLLLSL